MIFPCTGYGDNLRVFLYECQTSHLSLLCNLSSYYDIDIKRTLLNTHDLFQLSPMSGKGRLGRKKSRKEAKMKKAQFWLKQQNLSCCFVKYILLQKVIINLIISFKKCKCKELL